MPRFGLDRTVIADEGGFLICHRGGPVTIEMTTLAALASGAFLATQTIAGIIEKPEFDCIFQQGRDYSLFVQSVDNYCMLLVIHPAGVGVGAVKYFAAATRRQVALQMKLAHESGLDLSALNLANTAPLFQRRAG